MSINFLYWWHFVQRCTHRPCLHNLFKQSWLRKPWMFWRLGAGMEETRDSLRQKVTNVLAVDLSCVPTSNQPNLEFKQGDMDDLGLCVGNKMFWCGVQPFFHSTLFRNKQRQMLLCGWQSTSNQEVSFASRLGQVRPVWKGDASWKTLFL